MDYTLHKSAVRAPACDRKRRAIVPPKPGKGERQPRPYSVDELNALWATTHSQDWQAMVTLNSPPAKRIKSWPALRDTLRALKTTLTNWHRRKGFPAMIAVTEFDTDGVDGDLCANFHIGCASALSEEQQKTFTAWWLAQHALPDNRGRAFQHDADGGGKKLQDYLAKDISHRGGMRRQVKFPAPWLPERIETRLWFVVGAKRRPAREGAKLCAQRGLRRRRFDSEHGKTQRAELTASTGTPDSEHASTSITAVPNTHAATFTQTSQGIITHGSSPRQECPICRNRWGKSLWAGSCKCIPGFPFIDTDARTPPLLRLAVAGFLGAATCHEETRPHSSR